MIYSVTNVHQRSVHACSTAPPCDAWDDSTWQFKCAFIIIHLSQWLKHRAAHSKKGINGDEDRTGCAPPPVPRCPTAAPPENEFCASASSKYQRWIWPQLYVDGHIMPYLHYAFMLLMFLGWLLWVMTCCIPPLKPSACKPFVVMDWPFKEGELQTHQTLGCQQPS